MNNYCFKILLLTIFFNISFIQADEVFWLKHLLKKDKNTKPEKLPKAEIYMKNSYIFCTGNSKAAKANNNAANLMIIGEFEAASILLSRALKRYALFFPFRYNIGICYLHLHKLKVALLHFTKASQIVPQYAKTYIQIGYIYERWLKDDTAISYYRKALRMNKKELNTYVLIGDIQFKRKQLRLAEKYYRISLKYNHLFPNALLGLAKIHFIKKEYYKAMVLLKSIDTSGEYDKALHFYYAETSYKMKKYDLASKHYTLLLKYRNDKFFLQNDPSLIEQKLNLSNKLKDIFIR